ncbi:heavy-metal-associated domain-containing protein [Natrinema longum]|uniref:Heavy-metal-associated domain-containing protein n=1 Tax=Natrinema longum TaxID=370324 RepID=A0A8A2U7T3_9EURY|nr:heavy metal-associated domain-containing protein [Natrinema longum]MBZ6494012.1 heavy-metal-associated domain-containing protein [Natrinema longum]QSW84653.1 heavy-metal-associated domain-containing protein [Natrinema longum]
MTQITEYRVTDFDCPTCASNVERALSKADGVERVEVHYTTGRVEIEFDETAVDADRLERAITNQGYTPRPR